MDSVSIPVAFLAGIISFASPCFLPIVPVFLAYLTGGTGGGSEPAKIPALARAGSAGADGFITYGPTDTQKSTAGTRREGPMWGLANAAVFSLGFTAVFMGMWLVISLIGLSVGAYRGVLRIVGGVVLILLGLVTLGFFQNLTGRGGALERINTAGAPSLGRSALMGLGFAAAWSPCIGPVLGVILGLAMVRGSLGVGMLLLLSYCLGLAFPLLLMAAGVGGLRDRLSWFSRHGRVITIVAGILLIVIGFLLATDLLAPLSNVSLGGI